MASIRLIGKSLLRRNFAAALRTGNFPNPAIPRSLASVRNFSDDVEPVNIVDIAGRVVDDFARGEVLIDVGWSTVIKVVSGSKSMAQNMSEIKKDMNVAVTGSLGQKTAITEKGDNKFRLDKVNYVIAEDYKILPLIKVDDPEVSEVSGREENVV